MRNCTRLIVLSLFLYIFSESPPVFAASWSVSAHVSYEDSTICKFEMPIDMYLSSGKTFEKLEDICVYSINIIGPLVPSDIQVLRRVTAFLKANPRVRRPSEIVLDSPGGSIAAAMSIAREIRAAESPLYGIGSTVLQDRKCFSSCVFIVAASFRRNIYGEIGIHRPRFVEDEYFLMGYDSLQKAYTGLHKELKQFFESTNIHPSLIDDMWVVPSNELEVLDEAQMTRYGLNKNDLILEERRLWKLISVCGEAAPHMEKAFNRQVMKECADSTGEVDSACLQRLLASHEWRECYDKLYGR